MPSNRPRAGEHTVQFYASEDQCGARLADYVWEGLEDGDGILAAITVQHRRALKAALQKRGFDVDAALQKGRLRFIDAAEATSTFFAKGTPTAAVLEEHVGPMIDEVAAASRNGMVRAIGEIVSLLARSGRTKDAMALESAWSSLQESRPFSILCFYRLDDFPHAADHAAFLGVCGAHERVYPAMFEAYGEDPAKAAPRIAALEHLASCMELERASRAAIGHELREVEKYLGLPANLQHAAPSPAMLAELNGLLLQIVQLAQEIGAEPMEAEHAVVVSRNIRTIAQRALMLLGGFGKSPGVYS